MLLDPKGSLDVLVTRKSNFLFKKKNNDVTPFDVAKTNEIEQFILNHPWYSSRPLLVIRTHSNHKTNQVHKLTSLCEIITATKSSDPSGVKIPLENQNCILLVNIIVNYSYLKQDERMKDEKEKYNAMNSINNYLFQYKH